MLGQLKRSRYLKISHPLAFKRSSTTASATDSSLASSADDASPGISGKPQRNTRQRENQRTTNIIDRNTINRNRPRRSVASCVTFGEVLIREYDRSIGDWWDKEHSLGLGWDYVDKPAVPVPDDDEENGKQKAKFQKSIMKAKSEIIALLLVSRKKRKSMGIILADPMVNLEQTTAKIRISTKKKERRWKKTETKNMMPSYEDSKPTSKHREKLLINFGYSSCELNLSETERKLLRIEDRCWTGQSRKPSPLFIERCLADVKGD